MVDILVPLGFFAAVVAIVWLRIQLRQVQIAKQGELQQQLLAKFQSGEELGAFLASESGEQFMRQFESNPHRMILGTLAGGVVFLFLGLGFLVLAVWHGNFLYPGILTTSLGIGLMLAAWASRRLSLNWTEEPKGSADPVGT